MFPLDCEGIGEHCSESCHTEFGRIRAVGFIDPCYDLDINSQESWDEGVAGGFITIVPQTNGELTIDQLQGDGYGKRPQTNTVKEYTLTYNDPTFIGNYNFYDGASGQYKYKIFFRTSDAIYFSDTAVLITPNFSIQNDLGQRIDWTVTLTWRSKFFPVINTALNSEYLFACTACTPQICFFIQSVTGNLVDNTDPCNPVIDAAVSADLGNVLTLGSDGLPFFDGSGIPCCDLQEVTDAGNTTTNKIKVDALEFDLNPTNSPAAGQIAYEGNTGALAYLMNNSAVKSSIGQTLHAYVHNADSVTILKGQPVYIFGASGNKASVKLAANTSDSTSAKTLGLAAEDITSGQKGFVTCQGVLDGLNTGMYSDGDILYVGATAGTLTTTKPYAPNHLVYIGVVERANAGNGQIYVRAQNGYELDEIHDVDLITTPPVNNDILTYVTGSPNLWKPRSIGTILGYTPVNPTRSISTTSPLSGGGNLSADRTISIADAAADGTTKGAATFTANDFDSLAGVISLDYTNGQKATALLPGFLSAADWSIFNAKQDNIIKLVKLGADQTTTANTAQSDTELTTSALEANKTYAIYGRLRVGNNGAGGSRLGWNLPSGATGNVAIFAPTSSLTAFQIGGSNNSVLSTVSFTQNLTSNAYIMGSFTMGATVGTTNLIFASGTSGQTTTILGSGGSFAILIKMN